MTNLISIAVKSVPIRAVSMQEVVLPGLAFVVHVSIFKFNKVKIHFLCFVLQKILRLKIVDNALYGKYVKINTLLVSNLGVASFRKSNKYQFGERSKMVWQHFS